MELVVLSASNQAGGVTTFPDAVNASGTEQYFSVTVSVGKQYVACWSFGEDTASTASSLRRETTAPSFLPIDELMHVRRNLTMTQESATFRDAAAQEYSMAASEERTTPPNADTKKWFFVSLFSQTGGQGSLAFQWYSECFRGMLLGDCLLQKPVGSILRNCGGNRTELRVLRVRVHWLRLSARHSQCGHGI